MPDDVSDPDPHGDGSSDASSGTISDEELTALALAADPDPVLADDAVPFVSGDQPAGLLPEWYMPAPSPRRSRPRTVVLAGVAIALFVINVGGVCVTYGFPDPVWK